MDEDTEQLQEREFSADQRKALAAKGFALPEDWREGMTEAAPATPASMRQMAKMMLQGDSSDEAIVAKLVSMGMSEDEAKAMVARMRGQMSESSFSEHVQIIEAVEGKGGREWDVLLIASGFSKNGRHYPSSVLQQAAPLFEGVYAYADHETEAERTARPERSVKDKVGRYSGVTFGTHQVGGRAVEGLKARLKVVAPWLRETLVESVESGEPDFLGFSINADGRVSPCTHRARRADCVEAITKVASVDVVTDPAAGGRVVRLVASNTTPEGRIDMDKDELAALIAAQVEAALAKAKAEAPPPEASTETPPAPAAVATAEPTPELVAMAETVKALSESVRVRTQTDAIDAALKEATLSDAGKGLLRQRLVEAAQRRDLSAEEIETALREQTDYEAQFVQQFANPRGAVARIGLGDSMHEKYDKALEGLFEAEDIDGVPRFRSIKEAYCRWNGIDFFDQFDPLDFADSFSVKYDSHRSHKKIRESLTRSSWGEIFADNLYVKMQKSYAEATVYSQWEKFVSQKEDVPDFQTRHWARIGGYGDLATVAEQATYPTLTSPTDEEVTYAIAKRGGLDDVTLETLIDGRSNRMRTVPTEMARAAKRTLYKFVLNLITTDDPTMGYDAVTLYDAAHGNTNTTALSVAGLSTTQVAMRDQTAYNQSSEILGARNKIKFLIVPNELESRVMRILNPSDSYTYALTTTDTATDMDPQRWKGSGIEAHVYDQLTNAGDWWAVANPAETETLVVGFLNGNREPELFIQDDPKVGSNFTADKTTFKVRHIYGGAILDHRSFYYNDV